YSCGSPIVYGHHKRGFTSSSSANFSGEKYTVLLSPAASVTRWLTVAPATVAFSTPVISCFEEFLASTPTVSAALLLFSLSFDVTKGCRSATGPLSAR